MGRQAGPARRWLLVVGTALAVVLLHLVPGGLLSAAHAHGSHRDLVGTAAERGAGGHEAVPGPGSGHEHGAQAELGVCGLALLPAAGSAAPAPSAAGLDAAVPRARRLDASPASPPTDATRAPPDLHRMCVSRT